MLYREIESTYSFYRLVAAFVAVVALSGQLRCETLRDSVELHFRQSKTELDTAYMDNAKALRHAKALISRQHDSDSAIVLNHLDIVGAASPEGSVRFNEWLSRQRAKRIYDIIGERVVPNDSAVSYKFLGRDWHGLREAVKNDVNVPYRGEVIALLDEIIASSGPVEKANQGHLRRLKQLRGGVPYLYLYKKIFPQLRESRIVMVYDEKPVGIYNMPPIPDMAMFETTDIEIPAMPLAANLKQSGKPFYMGLKTNLLFDALAIPNIGADFYLGRNFSAVGNWMYGWWDVDRTHHYWRIYGGDLGLRWWFGEKAHRKPLTGHHVGIYGGVITYDFEFGGTGYMGGLPGRPLWARCNWYGGVEYGFSLPVARRFNLDFTIGVGVLSGKYIVYDPKDGFYVWRETHKLRWFGPTKAEISLVWLIGRGNVNEKKGARNE